MHFSFYAINLEDANLFTDSLFSFLAGDIEFVFFFNVLYQFEWNNNKYPIN
jgi:hypothetical protein